MKKKFLEIGKIVTTHGVMGEVKVYPLSLIHILYTDRSAG